MTPLIQRHPRSARPCDNRRQPVRGCGGLRRAYAADSRWLRAAACLVSGDDVRERYAMSDPRAVPQGLAGSVDPTEGVELLLRDLRAAQSGLTSREAERRLLHY